MKDSARFEKDGMTQFAIRHHGNVLHAEIHYPRSTNALGVEVDLIDVRATDSIRVLYDHHRNGWVIQQASIFEWDIDDSICDPDWQEVSFIPSWARGK